MAYLEHRTSVYTTEHFPLYCSLFISHLDCLWDSLPSATAPFPYAWLDQARRASDMWRERESGKPREGINSALFAPFISLSKGNAFVDAIAGGIDEMIKLEINCCFEQRRQSLWDTTGLVWEERSVFECWWVGGRRENLKRKKKKKCIIRSSPSILPTWKLTLNNLTQKVRRKRFTQVLKLLFKLLIDDCFINTSVSPDSGGKKMQVKTLLRFFFKTLVEQLCAYF